MRASHGQPARTVSPVSQEMTSRLADPAYVRFQYADDQKLRVRIETHGRYSENATPFTQWVLARLDARPGQLLLDVGSGPGQ